MATLHTFSPTVNQGRITEDQAQDECRRRMMRGEMYALAVLVGLQLSLCTWLGRLWWRA